jgi:hypothetical protein
MRRKRNIAVAASYAAGKATHTVNNVRVNWYEWQKKSTPCAMFSRVYRRGSLFGRPGLAATP